MKVRTDLRHAARGGVAALCAIAGLTAVLVAAQRPSVTGWRSAVAVAASQADPKRHVETRNGNSGRPAGSVFTTRPPAPPAGGGGAAGGEPGPSDIIDFEDLGVVPNTQINPPDGVGIVTNGFNYTPGPINDAPYNQLYISNQQSFWSWNGTTIGGTNDDVVLSRVDGAAFELRQFDFAGYPVNHEKPFTVENLDTGEILNFTPDGLTDGGPGGGVDFETFVVPEGFNGTAFHFVHFGPFTEQGLFALDNIVVGPGCGNPESGSCFDLENFSPFCDDLECCQTVCAVDPFCCDVQWDSLCVMGAFELCPDPPPFGACCLIDGSCLELLSEEDCFAFEGDWQGTGAFCSEVVCPVLIGACCFPDGSCLDLQLEEDCTAADGTYQGNGVLCSEVVCPVTPPNDLCADAIPIDVPSVTPGTTTLATIDSEFETCGTAITSPGVWYSVVGTGNTMTATTCGPLFDYDTKISVYCNDCAEPTCVDGNDDDCFDGADFFLSTVTWCSLPGAEYLVLVHGFGGQDGDFELFIEDDGVPCTGAVVCIPVGACCLPDESCVNDVTAGQCDGLGGEYVGDETLCDSAIVGYSAADCANAFEDISGTGTQLLLPDDGGEVIPIGFTFNFYGDDHTEIGVSSNGFLTFGADLSDLSEDPIPSTNDPNDMIAMLWDDLDPANAGSPATIHHQTLGDPGSRRLVVQFTDVPEFPDTGANTFQAVLYEGSNCIELRYLAITTTDFVAGIENQDGTDGVAVTATPGGCVSLCPLVELECPLVPCPWDCGDGNGIVGTPDLLALLAQWGTEGPCDLDGGGVGTTDLLALLGNWGLCEEACGSPGTGSCFESNGTPSCDDEDCCLAVCAVDPFCCDVAWDGICAGEAFDFCADPPPSGACCFPDGSCLDLQLEEDCTAADGTYQGNGVLCSEVMCAPLSCEDPLNCQGPNLSDAHRSNLIDNTHADNFVPDIAVPTSVTGLCWWGAYFSGGDCGPGPDDFTVNYYLDDGSGLPGTLIASLSQSGGTLSVDPPIFTGNIIAGVTSEYLHTASHPEVILDPGTCYWIEIYNVGPVDPCSWHWESGSGGDGLSALTTAGGPWLPDPFTIDHAFCLNVPLFGAPPCPSPETARDGADGSARPSESILRRLDK